MADRHLVEIFAGGLYLTGFLIGPRLVLTAGHGLVDGDGAPMIRRLSDVDGFECAVLWRGAPADLALLEVTDSRWRPGAGLTPVTWGRLPEPTAIHEGRVAVLCAARGFPVAQRRPDGVRVVETMWGRVHVGTGELSGMFQIHVTSGELEPVRGGSGWRGMSGGAVFADDMLIGVLVEDIPHVRARLSAVPATALLDDPAAVRILASCGVATAADPVRIRPARRERTNIQIGLVPNRAAFFQQRPEAARLDRALRELGPDHPDTLSVRHSIARWRGHAGSPETAIAELTDLVRDRTRVLGPDHRHTLTTRHNLAFWQAMAGYERPAVSMFEQVLADTVRVFGEEHGDTITNRHNLAFWQGRTQGPAEAVAALEELLPVATRVRGGEHPETVAIRFNLAHWRGEAGDPVAAMVGLQEVLAIRERVLGRHHPDTLITRNDVERWRRECPRASGSTLNFVLMPASPAAPAPRTTSCGPGLTHRGAGPQT